MSGSEISERAPIVARKWNGLSWEESISDLTHFFGEAPEEEIAAAIGGHSPLLAAMSAEMNWDSSNRFEPGWIFLTETHIVTVGNPRLKGRFRSSGWDVSAEDRFWSGTNVAFTKEQFRFQARRVFPESEWRRLLARFSGSGVWESGLRMLPDDWPLDPGRLPVGGYLWEDGGSAVIYRDRLIVDGCLHLPFSSPTSSTADLAGNVSAVRGRNLADKAFGTMFLGPFGLLMAGNAKVETIDNRSLVVAVENSDWSFVRECPPDNRVQVMEFASSVRRFADAFVETDPDQSAGMTPTGLAAELRELAALRDEGVISEEEFSAAKSVLLSGGLRISSE